MKRLLFWLIVFCSFALAQVDLRSFVGESLAYDVVFAGDEVAEIDIHVGLLNDSTMFVNFNCETISWAEIIFNEKDYVYTEIDLLHNHFTHSYRLADWRYTAMLDISEVYLTKDDSCMTYRYEKNVWFSNENKIIHDDTVCADQESMPYDLQEVLSASVLIRLQQAVIGEWLNLYILGSEEDMVGPETIPIYIEAIDTIRVDSERLETLRCRIAVPDDNWLFRKSKLNVWVTNDDYHLPLRGGFSVIDSIGLRVDLNLDKSDIPYWQDTKKQLIIE